MDWIASVLAITALAMPGNLAPSAPDSPAFSTVEFNRDIRPILSDHCFQCHGPDAAKRKADLRLDQEASAKADRDGRRAIVPGDLDGSELYRRITAEDVDERMPPAKSGKIPQRAPRSSCIRRWIAQGAKWQPHWAFIPPQAAAVPRGPATRAGSATRSTRSSWRGWSARGSRRRPRPSAATLIRRVTLDLTGLPPTPRRGRRVPRTTVARTPTRRWSIACWPRRATASGWPSAGSTRPAMPTPTAIRPTASASCGGGATG